MRIINVPIEPLEERYSTQWQEWFSSYFDQNGIEWTNVRGAPLRDYIKKGSFLDVAGTNYFKAAQLQQICRMFDEGNVKEGDVFFFHDLWFPGLEMIAYMRDALDLRGKIKICGCLHAGTYDPFDYLSQKGMEDWAMGIERSWWGRIADRIFVATLFHKQLLIFQRALHHARIAITGFPIFPTKSPSDNAGEIVVFPHRLNPEKQPELFDALAKKFASTSWRFLKTKEECPTKAAYYHLLSCSNIAVSFAQQETWGIAMQEATFCGCIPLVPDRLSYKEMYPRELRYNSEDELFCKVKEIMSDPNIAEAFKDSATNTVLVLAKKGREAIPNMVEEMRNL